MKRTAFAVLLSSLVALAPAWAGGVYYAAQRKSATPAEKQTPASLGVFYLSRWKTEEAARTFEKMYIAELGRKYSGVSERTSGEEAEGERIFTTSEGDALLTRRAKAKSARSAVVVRFSRSRERYERQGLLVEPHTLAEVQQQIEAQQRGR